jgi:hypothetical protein
MKPMIGQNIRFAYNNEFPFIVSMVQLDTRNRNNIGYFHLCTGSLITRKDVAISEHCIAGETMQAIQISVGSLDYRQGRKHSILWWLSFEQWTALNHRQIEFPLNDIANIRVKYLLKQFQQCYFTIYECIYIYI